MSRLAYFEVGQVSSYPPGPPRLWPVRRPRYSRFRSFAIVMTLIFLGLYQVASAQGAAVQELWVEWHAHVGAPAPEVPSQRTQPSTSIFNLRERRRVSGTLPKHRNPQLSEDHVVVEALDAQGSLIHSQVIPDPRVLRAELAGPNGELHGQILHHAATELLITLPDNPAITELRVYDPRWNGNTFLLDLLGTINLP